MKKLLFLPNIFYFRENLSEKIEESRDLSEISSNCTKFRLIAKGIFISTLEEVDLWTKMVATVSVRPQGGSDTRG